MNRDRIVRERDGAIGWIRISRPERLNAFVGAMREELLHALQEYEQDDEVRCIIITGAGPAFSTGGDITAMAELLEQDDRSRFEALLRIGADIVTQVDAMTKPVIASINGVAAGAGRAWRWRATCASRARARPSVSRSCASGCTPTGGAATSCRASWVPPWPPS
jgi:2-(1,2-epoxy-1,2-dihydrophenyl)acetyl-CoA isomerase